MQANWSLILNILLLIGVVVAIGRLMKARRQSLNQTSYRPSLGQAADNPEPFDDIIAVRKVTLGDGETDSCLESKPVPMTKTPSKSPLIQPTPKTTDASVANTDLPKDNEVGKSVMMFLLAKENRQLAGYELLQALLAAGLRFGEGHLFHRHQQANGQGPILFSLAAATSSGTFDLQNIGAFTVRGLCLFMHSSGNPNIDAERFTIMHDTAKQLSDGLDTHLLDDRRSPLNKESLARYYQQLHIRNESEVVELA